jgi:hypothetical protein
MMKKGCLMRKENFIDHSPKEKVSGKEEDCNAFRENSTAETSFCSFALRRSGMPNYTLQYESLCCARRECFFIEEKRYIGISAAEIMHFCMAIHNIA